MSTALAEAPDRKLTRAEGEALGDEIATLSARINAATYELLERIRLFDEQEIWVREGACSCAHWLSYRVGLDLGAAREKVRVARALAHLPAISERFARGHVSYSKVRALTRIATPESEGDLLNVALYGTASHVERLVRYYRRAVRPDEEQARHDSRHLTAYFDDDGMLVVQGRLPPEAGALVMRALARAEAEVFAQTRNAAQTEQPTGPQRRADALALVARQALAAESATDHERSQVVVHVDAEVLAGATEQGRCELEGPGDVSAEVSRRLACDGSVIVMRHGDNGEPLDLGRKTRVPNAALRRALRERDGGCRFPGCTSTQLVDAHHVRHWAQGGPTSLENLVLLCAHHHRLVHEGGYSTRPGPSGFDFFDPEGRLLPRAGRPVELPPPELGLPDRHGNLRDIPLWQGDRLDYSFALEGMLPADR